MPSLMETIKNLYKQETVQEEKKEILEQDDDVVEKEEMALSQLYFIEYAAEEIIEYIEEMDGEVEEWYQNKLSKIHSDMESLHSHVEGEKRRLKLDDEEDEDDEMEEQTQASHKVSVTVSDPNHPMVSKRDEKMEKKVIVNADNKDHAVVKAKDFYKKKGLKVHDANYHSPQAKSSMKTEELEEAKTKEQIQKEIEEIRQKIKDTVEGSVKGNHPQAIDARRRMVRPLVKKKEKLEKELESMKEEVSPPFTPDKPKKNPGVVPGKHGVGPSLAKHLAKKGMQKQLDKKKEMKEEEQLDELDADTLKSYQDKRNKDRKRIDAAIKKVAGEPSKHDVYNKGLERSRKRIEVGTRKAGEMGPHYTPIIRSKVSPWRRTNIMGEENIEEKITVVPSGTPSTGVRRVKLPSGGTITTGTIARGSTTRPTPSPMIANRKKPMTKEEIDLEESHFKVGQKVECIKSGMKGVVTKVDSPEEGKYYTVKQDSGKIMKYAPDELKALNEELETETLSIEETIKRVILGEKLHPNQKKLDVDKDGDIEADDFADLRAGKHKKKEEKVGKGKEQIDLKPKLDEKAPVAPFPDEETIHEEEMSDAEMKKREEIVKSLKKRTTEFKDRYGDRWKEVMYATATKMAMK
jgi:hypothetical protein